MGILNRTTRAKLGHGRLGVLCRIELDRLKETFPGLLGAVVSTSDGHAVAAMVPKVWNVGDISAMTSSLSALSESISQRSTLGFCRNVIVESELGKIVVMKVSDTLAIACIGPLDTNLGLQISAVRNCAVGIAKGMEEG